MPSSRTSSFIAMTSVRLRTMLSLSEPWRGIIRAPATGSKPVAGRKGIWTTPSKSGRHAAGSTRCPTSSRSTAPADRRGDPWPQTDGRVWNNRQVRTSHHRLSQLCENGRAAARAIAMNIPKKPKFTALSTCAIPLSVYGNGGQRTLPKIAVEKWKDHVGEPHPLSGQNDGPYAEIPLGDAVGLSQFGVHLERLAPGSRSSHRHWHETEDEFIYLISGELVLIEDRETLMRSGDAAGWKAGHPVTHCLENRSDNEAVMLVVGTRTTQDVVHYPDHDLILRRRADGRRFTRLDGSPIASKA